MAIENPPPTTPEQITADALGSFAGSGDARVREVMEALVRHLHAFITEVGLTPGEWAQAIEILTQTGHITDERRQEFILWSDALGLSMLVDALAHELPAGATFSHPLGTELNAFVYVYRGANRESFSCTPDCEPRITLGDVNAYFEGAVNQTATRSGAAQGAVQSAK